MAILPTIDGYADFVLTGENPSKAPVADAVAQLQTDAQPPPPIAQPIQRAHFLTYEEFIDQELIHSEKVNGDE